MGIIADIQQYGILYLALIATIIYCSRAYYYQRNKIYWLPIMVAALYLTLIFFPAIWLHLLVLLIYTAGFLLNKDKWWVPAIILKLMFLIMDRFPVIDGLVQIGISLEIVKYTVITLIVAYLSTLVYIVYNIVTDDNMPKAEIIVQQEKPTEGKLLLAVTKDKELTDHLAVEKTGVMR
jgi:hypothetical protein